MSEKDKIDPLTLEGLEKSIELREEDLGRKLTLVEKRQIKQRMGVLSEPRAARREEFAPVPGPVLKEIKYLGGEGQPAEVVFPRRGVVKAGGIIALPPSSVYQLSQSPFWEVPSKIKKLKKPKKADSLEEPTALLGESSE